jgi:DNA-binding FrmR family transcriptional regulator
MAEHVGHSYTKDRKVLLNRLRRLEGQVRGIARMVDREEYCVDILQQT